MYRIIDKKQLNQTTCMMTVQAPLVSRHCQPGQFIILRVDEKGERIPLTIADFDREAGTVSIIFQQVGATTNALATLDTGDFIADFAGPLGRASQLDGLKSVAVIGGGVGCAIAYPQAKKLFKQGCNVDLIAGFRNRDIVILEKEMKAASTRLFITTDDGSYGEKGLVTDKLRSLIQQGANYDEVIAIGPVIMMKFVCALTREFWIHTVVSLNPIMIDGTGMCGGCRVTVGGKVKFACVDGPEFDGHEVDFDELMRRNGSYKQFEQQAAHNCRLLK